MLKQEKEMGAVREGSSPSLIPYGDNLFHCFNTHSSAKSKNQTYIPCWLNFEKVFFYFQKPTGCEKERNYNLKILEMMTVSSIWYLCLLPFRPISDCLIFGSMEGGGNSI